MSQNSPSFHSDILTKLRCSKFIQILNRGLIIVGRRSSSESHTAEFLSFIFTTALNQQATTNINYSQNAIRDAYWLKFGRNAL